MRDPFISVEAIRSRQAQEGISIIANDWSFLYSTNLCDESNIQNSSMKCQTQNNNEPKCS